MAKLNPLIIPSIDYIGNPGLGYYDLYDTESKPVALSALMHDAVLETDYVELLLGTVPFDEETARVVDEYYINVDHLSAGILSFTVNSLLIADSPPNAAFYYRSYSGPFENESSSDPRSVLVKRPIPGDPTIGAVYVNDKLAPPDGVPRTEISVATPQTLTVAAWGNMAAGDVLTLFWGGNRFKVSNPPLSPSQIGTQQTIVVPAALITQAGDSEHLQVNYEIRDTVNNWSLYSRPAFADVRVDPNAPGAPVLPGVPHAGSLYSLNLASLAGANVLASVPRSLPLIVGDTLTLTWEGQNADGTPITTPIKPVDVTDPEYVSNFIVPYEYIAAIASGSARVYYRVTHDGVEGARSKSITVNVVGEVMKLAAPQISEAVGSQLDPAHTTSGATLVIPPYSGMDAGQQIIVTWAGYPQIGPPQTYIVDDIWLNSSDKGNPVVRAVDAQWVKAFAGGRLEVSYLVNTFSTLSSHAPPAGAQMFSAGRTGDAVRPGLVALSKYLGSSVMFSAGAELKAGLPLTSDVLRLDVVGEVILLTPPTVDQQADGFLDPALVLNGTTVRIPNYLGKGQGETLNMHWEGVPGSGTTGDSTVVRSAGQPVNFAIGAPYITANLNRRVEVRYETVLNGRTERSESLAFSVQSAIVDLPVPGITPLITDIFDVAGLTGTALLKISPWSPIAAGQKIWIYCDGKTSSGADYSLPIRVNSTITTAEAILGIVENLTAAQLAPFGHGTTMTVRAKVQLRADGQESQAVEFPLFTVRINNTAWVDSFDNFAGGSRGTWTWGPAAVGGLLLTPSPGEYYFFQESVPGNNYAGVIFEKTVEIPLMSSQYAIGFRFTNTVPITADPNAVNPEFRIEVSTTGEQSTVLTAPRGSGWINTGFATRSIGASQLTVKIVSLQAGADGNAYVITNLSITRV